MKITLDVPERELRDAMRFTSARTKSQAVLKAILEFNRRCRMSELTKHAGTFSDTFPTNQAIEATGAWRDRKLNPLVASGRARWGGGKPEGLKRPARLKKGKTLTAAVLKDRR